VTYVIDGLDECSEGERGSLLDVFLPFLQCNASPPKLLLASRNKHDIATRLGRFPQMVVDATKNSADIRAYCALIPTVQGHTFLRPLGLTLWEGRLFRRVHGCGAQTLTTAHRRTARRCHTARQRHSSSPAT
jgi:hypothetical protein